MNIYIKSEKYCKSAQLQYYCLRMVTSARWKLRNPDVCMHTNQECILKQYFAMTIFLCVSLVFCYLVCGMIDSIGGK